MMMQRLGRCLISFQSYVLLLLLGDMVFYTALVIFFQKDLQSHLYLSLFFKRHRAEYYRLLGEVRRSGDWEAWTEFFLEGIATIAAEAVAAAREVFALITEDRRRLVAAPGASVMAVRLIEQLPIHPVVSIPAVVKLLKTTKPTAGKAVQLLENLGGSPRRAATDRRRARGSPRSGPPCAACGRAPFDTKRARPPAR